MPLFLLKRTLTFIATLLAASLLVFWALERLPGSAAQVMLGETATPEAVAALERKLGLDQPGWTRYGQWVIGLLTGRSDLSIAYDTPT